MPSEVEIILSLNEYVLSLHNMSGAEDIMVKKIHKALTFFSFKMVEETYYKYNKCYIYIWKI